MASLARARVVAIIVIFVMVWSGEVLFVALEKKLSVVEVLDDVSIVPVPA